MSEQVFTPAGLDALPPPEMAEKAERIGVAKAAMGSANTFALAVLAGAFIALGAFCNALVCLAVWLTYSDRSLADKVLAIVPPIAAFVAAGFEHSVANMFFIPMGLLVKGNHSFVTAHPDLPDLSRLTWGRFVASNLVPVTIGNVIGGGLMVGAVYWFVYLRGRPAL